MYERFTDRAREVMQLADQEASRWNHEYIGTEHLLLGLMAQGPGVAEHVLKYLGVELAAIRSAVERIMCSGPQQAIRRKLPQTPRAKKVIEFAMEEARKLNHNYVGTEHLLLGLLREDEGVASQILQNLGVRLEIAREAVSRLLGENPNYMQLSERMSGDSQPKGLMRRFGRWVRYTLGQMRENSQLFARFTDHARKVMRLANQEAKRLNHEYIGTEHILLGLIKEKSGVAAKVLKHLKVDVSEIRTEAEKIVQPGPDKVIMGRLPQTPRGKKAIEYAQEEAFSLSHNYVGTEHLLLGLLRETEGVAAQVLMNLGLKLDDVRTEVLDLLGRRE